MKLSPGDLKVTRPATKVDEQEKERIEEAINVTSAKMYDKAMELDTQHSVEYIEAAELAALSALSLPTAAHAAGLAASLRQGHTLAVTAVNQTFALDSGTAPEVKPAGGSATSDADKQFLEQLISRFALDCDVQLDPNKPIVDQLRNQAIQAEIADRLANSDPNGFVPIATLWRHFGTPSREQPVMKSRSTEPSTSSWKSSTESSANGRHGARRSPRPSRRLLMPAKRPKRARCQVLVTSSQPKTPPHSEMRTRNSPRCVVSFPVWMTTSN